MSEPLPEDAQGHAIPETEARYSDSPPTRSTTPGWDDPALQPSTAEQPAQESNLFMGAFTVEPGGRSGISGTAERIGSAVGAAHREVRRRLELVRGPSAPNTMFPSFDECVNHIAREGDDDASRMMEDIEDEVFDLRRLAARRLDDWSDRSGQRVQQFSLQVEAAFSGARAQVHELAERFPLQTIAAIAGVCFAMGIALRLRRSHRG